MNTADDFHERLISLGLDKDTAWKWRKELWRVLQGQGFLICRRTDMAGVLILDYMRFVHDRRIENYFPEQVENPFT